MSVTREHVHLHAHCDDCNKGFRVSNPDRTYTCNACGGVVRPDVESAHSAESPIEGTVTCTECEAINPGGTHYCAECGATLEFSEAVEGSEAAAKLRHEASEALKSAYKTINAVTLMYRGGAIAYAIATFFAVLSLARPEVPRNAGLLVIFMTTAMSVLLLMGAIHIQLRPFRWTVAIAVLATSVSLVHLLGPNPYGVALFGSLLWAVFAWAAMVPMLRFRKLIAKHKDLYVLHHASAQTRRSLGGRSAHERHERLMSAMRRAAERAWRLSFVSAGGFGLLSAAGSIAVLSAVRPAEFTDARADFEAAWEQADLEAVEEFFDPRVREAEAARLEGLLSAHGLLEAPPQLSGGQVTSEGSAMKLEYDLGELPMSIEWAQVGSDWQLARIDLPVPSFDPVLARFQRAWQKSDAKAIAGFYSPDSRAEMFGRLSKSFEGRGWSPLPEVLNSDVTYDSERAVSVVLVLEPGNVLTEWAFREESGWRLHGFRLPKR